MLLDLLTGPVSQHSRALVVLQISMHGLEPLFAFSATVLHTLVLICVLNIADQRESLIHTHSITVSLKHNVRPSNRDL